MKDMSKESLEHLSSLMDGELSRESGLFLTRRLSSDEKMCDKWERYHLIRDCIRQPGSKQMVTGLRVGLKASMEAEELPAASSWTNRWLKPVSGLAIAASVAMVAIVATAPQQVATQGGEGAAQEAKAQPFVSPNSLPLTPGSQAASFAPAQQGQSNHLNAYLLRHNQMAKMAGRQGFVSFVAIVANKASSSDTMDDDAGTDEARPEQETVENR